jgi:hypothetical protein
LSDHGGQLRGARIFEPRREERAQDAAARLASVALGAIVAGGR